MGKGNNSSNSSSSISSSSNRNRNRHRHHQQQLVISTASSFSHQQLPTDLSLGLAIPTTHHQHYLANSSIYRGEWEQQMYQQGGGGEVNMNMNVNVDCGEHSSLFVKVYMEGIPIGRKLNILAHESYHDLVSTLENMFDTTILWGTEMDGVQPERCHVLTYEDEEGDLVMVGDVPWEMFVSTVKRLKITRVDAFGC